MILRKWRNLRKIGKIVTRIVKTLYENENRKFSPEQFQLFVSNGPPLYGKGGKVSEFLRDVTLSMSFLKNSVTKTFHIAQQLSGKSKKSFWKIWKSRGKSFLEKSGNPVKISHFSTQILFCFFYKYTNFKRTVFDHFSTWWKPSALSVSAWNILFQDPQGSKFWKFPLQEGFHLWSHHRINFE